MVKITKEELIQAYEALEERCMTQSASWVLEFLFKIDSNAEITDKKENIQISFAKTLFRNGEFKRAQQILSKKTDQVSISIYFLSKLLDTQRQLTQNIPEDSTFIGDLPVSTKRTTENYMGISKELETLGKTTELDPLNLYILGLAYAKSGLYDKACDALLTSLNGFPINYSAWKQLILVLTRFDNNKITEAVQRFPNHVISDIFKVQLKSELQTEDAVASFTQLDISNSFPRVAPIIALEAEIHYNDRNFEKSAQIFTELRENYPYRLDGLELYSNLLFVKEDLAALSQLAQELSQIDKYRPETLTVLGNFYALSGWHAEAIEYFSQALRFDADYNFAWTLIGHEYVELQNIPAATASYTKAFEANPRDFRALYGLGRAFELSTMPYHAILFYRKAVIMNPSDSRLWMALGECYEELDQIENAIKCYQRAVCNTDDEGSAIFKLGILYKASGDQDRAAFCFGSFIEKRNGDEGSSINTSANFSVGVADTEDDTEKRESEREAISFLAHYYLSKKDKEKADQYANMMLQDPTLAQEGKSLMKDINSLSN